MASRPPFRRPVFGGLSGGGGAPRDLVALLAVLFVTFSLQFFATSSIVPALMRLTPAVWQQGFVWQPFTYPLAGFGPPSLWFLLELLILFLFGRDVFSRLGRRAFWLLLGWTCVPAALVALLADGLFRLLGAGPLGASLMLMQGQRMLLTVLIVAFATLNRHATIFLFFVLPIQARWFIPLTVVIGFLGFLGTRDLAGFLGLCAGVGLTWGWLQPGGIGRGARELWLRAQQGWLRHRMDRLRRKRGFRVVRGEGERDLPPDLREPRDRDPWVH
jgi:hypothetical protein